MNNITIREKTVEVFQELSYEGRLEVLFYAGRMLEKERAGLEGILPALDRGMRDRTPGAGVQFT